MRQHVLQLWTNILSEIGKIESLTHKDESSDQNTEKTFTVFEVVELESDVHQAGGFDKLGRMKQNLNRWQYASIIQTIMGEEK
jgi:hypothetical protein